MHSMPPARTLSAALVLAVSSATSFASAQSGHGPASSMQSLARQVASDFGTRAAVAAHDGRVLEAEALYRRAIEADAGYLAGYLGYARLLASRGHNDEALRVLDATPRRAYEIDTDLVQIARVRAAVGDLDGALSMLAARVESVEAARSRAELTASAGRFPEALLAARHLLDLVRESDLERQAEVLVHALTLVVGDADAVAAPGPSANALRRLLAE